MKLAVTLVLLLTLTAVPCPAQFDVKNIPPLAQEKFGPNAFSPPPTSWAEGVLKNERVDDYNKKHEKAAKKKILEKYPEDRYYVGFSKPIHARDGVRMTIQIWGAVLGIDTGLEKSIEVVAKDLRSDLTRIERGAKAQGIDIKRQQLVAVDQLWVKHREGVGPIVIDTPRSWIFYAVWPKPGPKSWRWLDGLSDGKSVTTAVGRSHGTVWLIEAVKGRKDTVRLRTLNANFSGKQVEDGVKKRWLEGTAKGTVGLSDEWNEGTQWRIEKGDGHVRLRSLHPKFGGDGVRKRWLGAGKGMPKLDDEWSKRTEWILEDEKNGHIRLRKD